MTAIDSAQTGLRVLDLLKAAQWSEQGPRTRLLADSDSARLVLMTLRADQVVKEHRAPSQLLVQVLDGCVLFTAAGQTLRLQSGMICQLAAGIPHHLSAEKDSVLLLIMTPSPAGKLG